MKQLILAFIFVFFYLIDLIAYEPEIIWQFDTKDMSFGNACAGDIDNDGYLEIVFSTYFNDGHIYAINSEDGSLLWKYDIGGCSDAAPIIYDIDNDGNLEVILHSSSVPFMFCFNGADGTLKWKRPSRATDSPPSIEDVDNDGIPEIFDGDFGGYVARYNAQDGSKIWETIIDTGLVVQTAPVIADIDGDGELDLAVATYSFDTTCSIVALRAKDGTFLWRSNEKTKAIYHGPVVADVDNDGINEVLVSDYGGFLYCLNGIDGSTEWKYQYPGGGYSGSPVTIADLNNDGRYEIIYFCNKVLLVLSGDGEILWTHSMINGQYSFRGAIVLDINNDFSPDIVFGDNKGGLTAINGHNGKLIWYLDFEEIYGKRFDLLHGPIASDFNNDGLIDLFFVGGWAEYPEITNNYGRAYMISVGPGYGPDWLMFRKNARRNAVLPKTISSVGDNDIPRKKLTIYYSEIDQLLHLNLNNSESDIVSISLFDLTGRKLYRAEAAQKDCIDYQINCSKYSAGFYILVVSTGLNVYNESVIISK